MILQNVTKCYIYCDSICYFMYAGLSLEKYNYFVSEGDGFVEACGNLYGRRGLSVDVQFYTSGSRAQGIF